MAEKLQPERGVRTHKRNAPADTKVSEEGEGGVAPGTRAEVPLQPMVKATVRQAVPLQPMEVHGGADIHLQPMEDPMLEQVDAQRRLGPHGKRELPMGSQPPSGTHLLRRGVLPGLQGDSLPHHGLPHGLQGNLCSGAWSISSPSFCTDLGVCRAVSFTCSHSSLRLPFLSVPATFFSPFLIILSQRHYHCH